MPNRKIAGLITFNVDGTQYEAKGNFTYGLGNPKRESVLGAGGYAGYKEVPQVAFIEGEIIDMPDLDLGAFLVLNNVTVTLELGNGKNIVLHEAVQVAEGTGNSEEANISVRFEGARAEEIT
ncbi:MAG: phage tail tube protein [Pseudomonadota bacterium]